MAVEARSKDELHALQLLKLRELLHHANDHVPYYQRLFSRLGFNPEVRSIEELSNLPFLQKETIRRQQQELMADNRRWKKLFKGTTSGTTGESMTLFMDGKVIKSEFVFADRQYRWAGARCSSRSALLRGDLIVPADRNRPPFWRYDAISRQLWFSSYHLSDSTVESYVQKLCAFDPEVIFAYPSSIFCLCQLARSKKLDFTMSNLKSIVTSSETLFDPHRRVIEETLGVRVFDWYGLFERVIFIGTCPHGSYHVFPDYGVTEYLPAGIDETGEQLFELVGTGFINKAMPLIRYRTGDIVKLGPETECPCGSNFPTVASIQGRANDVIITPSGKRLGMLEFAFDIENILCGQIIQESLDRLEVLVVPDSGFSEASRNQVIRKLRERIDRDMTITLKCVDAIPRAKTGKFRLLVSKL
jgi:phenylacetate-CoA ligase